MTQGGRPLLSPSKIEDLLARGDHTAVGDAGHHRRNLTRGNRHHRLVQTGHTFDDLPHRNQGEPHARPGHGHQVRIAEAVSDLGRPIEGGLRRGQVAIV